MGLQERSNYLEDDWNDNALTARTSPEEGYFLHPSDGLTGTGDYEPGDALKGVYRPDWEIESGSPSASNGELVLPPGDTTNQTIAQPAEFTSASMEDDVYHTDHSGGRMDLTPRLRNGDSEYTFSVDAYDDVYVYSYDGSGGTRIIESTNNMTYSAWVKWRLTLDSYANWEAFKDGTSLGTTTDDGQLPPEKTAIRNAADVECKVDNMVIQ